MAQSVPADQNLRTDQASLGRWQGWHYVPGIASLAIGILALAEPPLASLAATVYLGAMLGVAGIFMFVAGVANIRRGGWFALFLGLLCGVTALAIFANPVATAVSIVWIMGAFLIIGGIFELVVGLKMPIGRAWLILISLVNIALGVFAFMLPPAAAFAFLGYFLGLNLVVQGLWWLAFPLSRPAALSGPDEVE